MRVSLLGAALLISLATIGCGGTNVDIKGSGHQVAVKWGKPKGGQEPKGVVMLLPGGGWQPNKTAYLGLIPTAEELQSLGFATVVVGYGEGATGFQDVKQAYEKTRQRYPGLPICAQGVSAGGNLALMLAAREPGLTCVVGLATPTDLTALKDQGGDEAYDMAVTAFGEDQLANWSPIRYADRIKAKVLLINGENDPVDPVEQGREFARKRPQTELVILPEGSVPVPSLHGATVTPQAAQSAIQRGFFFLVQSLVEG
jgi:dipeptidyl aminopeptidase/acylaminoacyl peptidase